MRLLIVIPSLLVAGALVTSYVEYKYQYNLYDFLKDKVLDFLRIKHS